jgi:hypothetical protein
MTSYTYSGVKGSPYCSSSVPFRRMRRVSTEPCESMTLKSRMNMILDGVSTWGFDTSPEILHGIDKRSLALEIVRRALRNLVQKVVKRYTENKDLKNLKDISRTRNTGTRNLQNSYNTNCPYLQGHGAPGMKASCQNPPKTKQAHRQENCFWGQKCHSP